MICVYLFCAGFLCGNSRVVEANGPKAIVMPACDQVIKVSLREGDMSWNKFLELGTAVDRY